MDKISLKHQTSYTYGPYGLMTKTIGSFNEKALVTLTKFFKTFIPNIREITNIDIQGFKYFIQFDTAPVKDIYIKTSSEEETEIITAFEALFDEKAFVIIKNMPSGKQVFDLRENRKVFILGERGGVIRPSEEVLDFYNVELPIYTLSIAIQPSSKYIKNIIIAEKSRKYSEVYINDSEVAHDKFILDTILSDKISINNFNNASIEIRNIDCHSIILMENTIKTLVVDRANYISYDEIQLLFKDGESTVENLIISKNSNITLKQGFFKIKVIDMKHTESRITVDTSSADDSIQTLSFSNYSLTGHIPVFANAENCAIDFIINETNFSYVGRLIERNTLKSVSLTFEPALTFRAHTLNLYLFFEQLSELRQPLQTETLILKDILLDEELEVKGHTGETVYEGWGLTFDKQYIPETTTLYIYPSLSAGAYTPNKDYQGIIQKLLGIPIKVIVDSPLADEEE
jgi:hypothetical protein